MFSTEILSWGHIILFIAIVLFVTYLAERYHSRLLTLTACLTMVAVSGLRHGYIDTRAYRFGFQTLDTSKVLNWDFLLNGESKDKGFSVLSAVIKLFTDNSQMFLFIFALITVGCLFYGITKNAPEMTFGVFLFICTGCYIDTMNGMRQAFVAAILFVILPKCLQQKQLLPYVIAVVLLATVHGSALLFLPIYFIADKKAWSKATWWITGVTLVIFIYFNSGIGSFVVNLLDGTTYADDYGAMLMTGNTSVNVIRPFVALVPVALSFFTKDNEKKDFPLYHICFNMSLINFLIWLFATKVLYFYRLAAYFQPYTILLLCFQIYYIKDPKDKQMLKTAAVVLYTVWHIYSLHATGNNFFVGYLKY